jgi:hypothetical protein
MKISASKAIVAMAVAVLVWIDGQNSDAAQLVNREECDFIALKSSAQKLVLPVSELTGQIEKIEEEDPMVSRWKNNEVRRSSGLDSDRDILERLLVIGASVVGLLILFRIAFPH